VYVKRNFLSISHNYWCHGKAINIIYPVYNCSISYISCKTRAPLMVLSVGCLVLEYFSTLSHQQHDFQKKVHLNMKCLFCFPVPPAYEIFLILKRMKLKYTLVFM